MFFSKIFGFIILLCGLAIIFWALYQVYGVYTQKITVPSFFEVPEETKSIGDTLPKNIGTIDQKLQSLISQQIGQIIPSGSIAQILNFVAFSILLGLVIYGGSQVAGIGIKLMKD